MFHVQVLSFHGILSSWSSPSLTPPFTCRTTQWPTYCREVWWMGQHQDHWGLGQELCWHLSLALCHIPASCAALVAQLVEYLYRTQLEHCVPTASLFYPSILCLLLPSSSFSSSYPSSSSFSSSYPSSSSIHPTPPPPPFSPPPTLRPDQMTIPVWDYVFYGGDLPQTDIPTDALRYVQHGSSFVQNTLTCVIIDGWVCVRACCNLLSVAHR